MTQGLRWEFKTLISSLYCLLFWDGSIPNIRFALCFCYFLFVDFHFEYSVEILWIHSFVFCLPPISNIHGHPTTPLSSDSFLIESAPDYDPCGDRSDYRLPSHEVRFPWLINLEKINYIVGKSKKNKSTWD